MAEKKPADEDDPPGAAKRDPVEVTVEYIKENDFGPLNVKKYAPRSVYKPLRRSTGKGYFSKTAGDMVKTIKNNRKEVRRSTRSRPAATDALHSPTKDSFQEAEDDLPEFPENDKTGVSPELMNVSLDGTVSPEKEKEVKSSVEPVSKPVVGISDSSISPSSKATDGRTLEGSTLAGSPSTPWQRNTSVVQDTISSLVNLFGERKRHQNSIVGEKKSILSMPVVRSEPQKPVEVQMTKTSGTDIVRRRAHVGSQSMTRSEPTNKIGERNQKWEKSVHSGAESPKDRSTLQELSAKKRQLGAENVVKQRIQPIAIKNHGSTTEEETTPGSLQKKREITKEFSLRSRAQCPQGDSEKGAKKPIIKAVETSVGAGTPAQLPHTVTPAQLPQTGTPAQLPLTGTPAQLPQTGIKRKRGRPRKTPVKETAIDTPLPEHVMSDQTGQIHQDSLNGSVCTTSTTQRTCQTQNMAQFKASPSCKNSRLTVPASSVTESDSKLTGTTPQSAVINIIPKLSKKLTEKDASTDIVLAEGPATLSSPISKRTRSRSSTPVSVEGMQMCSRSSTPVSVEGMRTRSRSTTPVSLEGMRTSSRSTTPVNCGGIRTRSRSTTPVSLEGLEVGCTPTGRGTVSGSSTPVSQISLETGTPAKRKRGRPPKKKRKVNENKTGVASPSLMNEALEMRLEDERRDGTIPDMKAGEVGVTSTQDSPQLLTNPPVTRRKKGRPPRRYIQSETTDVSKITKQGKLGNVELSPKQPEEGFSPNKEKKAEKEEPKNRRKSSTPKRSVLSAEDEINLPEMPAGNTTIDDPSELFSQSMGGEGEFPSFFAGDECSEMESDFLDGFSNKMDISISFATSTPLINFKRKQDNNALLESPMFPMKLDEGENTAGAAHKIYKPLPSSQLSPGTPRVYRVKCPKRPRNYTKMYTPAPDDHSSTTRMENLHSPSAFQRVCSPRSMSSSLHEETVASWMSENQSSMEASETSLEPQRGGRQAARRARTNIQSFIRDMGKEDKYVTKESAEEEEQNLPEVKFKLMKAKVKPVTKYYAAKWKKELAEKHVIQCPYYHCQESFGNYKDIVAHYVACKYGQDREDYYECGRCKRKTKTEAKAEEHAARHNWDISAKDERKQDSDVDFGPELSERESDSDDAGDAQEYKSSRKKHHPGSTRGPGACLKRRGIVSRGLLQPPSQERLEMLHTLSWTLNWRSQHRETDMDHIEGWRPRACNWQPMPPSEAERYLPQTRVSPWYRGASHKDKDNKQKLQYLSRFKSSTEDLTMLYVGGPVWSMAWLPREDGILSTQYLAVYAHRHPDQYHSMMHTSSSPSSIQVWECGTMRTETMDEPPKLSLVIAEPDGPVWDMKWCPRRSYEKDESYTTDTLPVLGLLAAATCSGKIHIYSVPEPSSLPTHQSDVPIYITKPIFTLLPHTASTKAPDLDEVCLCLDWQYLNGTRRLLAGYSLGMVAIFDIGATSPLLKVKGSVEEGNLIFPIVTFMAHQAPVTGLALSQRRPQFFTTVSQDRMMKVWNMENLDFPINAIPKSEYTAAAWPLHWPVTMCGADNCYSLEHNAVYLIDAGYFGLQNRPLTVHNACIMDLSFSDWLNSLVSVDSAGVVMGIYLPFLLSVHKNHKAFSSRRMVLYSVDCERLDPCQCEIPSHEGSVSRTMCSHCRHPLSEEPRGQENATPTKSVHQTGDSQHNSGFLSSVQKVMDKMDSMTSAELHPHSMLEMKERYALVYTDHNMKDLNTRKDVKISSAKEMKQDVMMPLLASQNKAGYGEHFLGNTRFPSTIRENLFPSLSQQQGSKACPRLPEDFQRSYTEYKGFQTCFQRFPDLMEQYKDDPIEWNPNFGCHLWQAVAGESGLVRLLHLPLFSNKQEADFVENVFRQSHPDKEDGKNPEEGSL